MRGSIPIRVLLLAVCCGACGSGRGPDLVVPATVHGLARPVAVVHDPKADVYLVANQGGGPGAQDGGPCISRLAPDGRLELRWIDGGRNGVELHAPRGLALGGDELFVADVDTVRVFDRASGRPRRAIPVPSAVGLQDVAVLADGTLYASDRGPAAGSEDADAVWRIAPGGAAVALARGRMLDRPSALVATDHGVFLVTAGGLFCQLDRDGRRTELIRAPANDLVGLTRVPLPDGADRSAGQGRWFASSRAGRCIYEFDIQGRAQVATADLDQPADLACDLGRQRLLVPLSAANELRILPLPTAPQTR